MYPRGIACGTDQCRNSINGTCSNDCSSEVCSQPVPSGRYFMVLTRLFEILMWCQYKYFENCEDTKGVTRSRKSKEIHYDDKNKYSKRTHNDLQNTTQKTKDQVIRTQLKCGDGLGCSGKAGIFFPTSGICRVTLIANPVISLE